MPQFFEVFEKRLYVFSFPTYIVHDRRTAFYQLKPTVRGNVSFSTLTRLLFVLVLEIVFLTLKITFGPKIFLTSQKNIKHKHGRGYLLRALNYVFMFVLLNYFK